MQKNCLYLKSNTANKACKMVKITNCLNSFFLQYWESNDHPTWGGMEKTLIFLSHEAWQWDPLALCIPLKIHNYTLHTDTLISETKFVGIKNAHRN